MSFEIGPGSSPQQQSDRSWPFRIAGMNCESLESSYCAPAPPWPRMSAKRLGRAPTMSLFPRWVERFRKPTNPRSGSNFCARIGHQLDSHAGLRERIIRIDGDLYQYDKPNKGQVLVSAFCFLLSAFL